MKQRLRWFWILILSIMSVASYAQEAESEAFVLQVGADGIPQIGETQLPGPSLYVDFNPQSDTSWARVNDFGQLLFAPLNTPEGVYTFSPYFQGFSAPSLEENRLRVVEAEWSPNGQQLAFRLNSDNPVGSDGIWFWQPAIETATDPSYHLLRDCPPGCALANGRDTGKWESLSIDWSPDNVAILSRLYLPDEERFAIGIVFASRDPESPQADIQPITYRYDNGSWTPDGQQIVVGGRDEDDNQVFGVINRDGSNPQLQQAADIGLATIRSVVMRPDTNELVLLASPDGGLSPAALYDADGNQLTPLIGDHIPEYIQWSPQHDAVLIRGGSGSFIATIYGDVYNITSIMDGNPMVSWVEAGFPENTRVFSLPQPLILQPPPTPVLITVPPETPSPDDPDADSQTLYIPKTEFQPGQLLQVASDELTIYAEPVMGAETLATLSQGEALVTIGGPLTDGVTVWWRIQTLDDIGWIEESVNGSPQISN